MSKFNLCSIRPKGFAHTSAFAEVKDSLAWSLAALGHSVMMSENCLSAGESRNIIFGAELLPPTHPIPDGSVIYNLEQFSHPNIANVRSLAQNKTVWDFSLRQVAHWREQGYNAVHVPVGYTKNLTRVPKAEVQDFDVCFMGWMTPRRTKIVNDLRAAGLKVFASDSCYGGARDNILSRSKICLNVHHDGRDMFEIVRVSYLLANRMCVVSEFSSDDQDYMRDLDGAMEWWKYEDIVERCVELCRIYPDKIDHNAGKGFEAIRKLDYVSTVAAALGPQFTHEPILGVINEVMASAPTLFDNNKIKLRYERACRVGDMVDFTPWLREHAKGNILEIGTRDGASTSAFLLGLEEHGGHLTSIDVDDCSGLWNHPQWTFIRGTSLSIGFVEGLNSFHDGQFDLALIDGNHEEAAVIGDLFNCYHWVRPGGMILVHDVTPERGHEFYSVQLRERFDWFAKLKGLRSEILPGKYGMGVLYR